ncbi:MAG: M3 family oligoendopeptidase [Clostridiales bacterium]|nr:M3 family oligoendopeptidase [Clostridiales bacterium]
MTTEWSLDVLYKGLDDPAYEEDIKIAAKKIEGLKTLVKKASGMQQREMAEQILTEMEQFIEVVYRLMDYVLLSQSVDTENGALMAQVNRLNQLLASYTPVESAARKCLAEIENVEQLAGESEVVKDYIFFLNENKKSAKHLLADEVEEMAAAMDITGGSAWGNLFSYLTSTVKVDYEGKTVTLSEVRNMAYSPDGKVRKAAYEAELASYEKIADSLAFALNNIKSQVRMMSEKRGYESPLAMTLEQSRMSRATLDAMMAAIEEYLPVFRKYLRKKAELLGYQNGLPWYELFAPLGKADKTYTIEEAKNYLIECFRTFTPDMAEMMKEAFENSWIDFYPKKGKEGGAFCQGLLGKKQSRILTNYDGYFGSIGTLAHELGHAYHNRQLEGERSLNQEYPMPVAETASTFNETHLGRYALKRAKGEERLNLLENDLREQTQCIVDIYSRYLFETAVFEQGQEKFLMAEDCKALMIEAQKKAYGDGLDSEYLHPYMWACKSHYYSSGLSFYNFPYAFGNLFALGLYDKFLQEGEAFVPGYKAMLAATPCCTIEEAGKMAGIDLTSVDFWKKSLAMIAENVEEFCSYSK